MNYIDLFSSWILACFILFYCKLTTFNPIILLYSAMILVTLCAIAIYIQTNDMLYFYFFVFVNIIIKVVPIFLIRNEKIQISDYLFSILIISIYLLYLDIIREKNVFNLYYNLYQSYIHPERYDENDNTLKYLINNYTSFKVSAPMSGMLSP